MTINCPATSNAELNLYPPLEGSSAEGGLKLGVRSQQELKVE